MTAFDKFLSDWKRVSEAASSAPWHIGHISETDDSACIDGPELQCIGRINYREDQSLVCHARNNADRMVRMVEAARDCIETFQSIVSESGKFAAGKQMHDCATQALAELDRIAGEGT